MSERPSQRLVPFRRGTIGDLFDQMQRDLDDMSDFVGMPKLRSSMMDPFKLDARLEGFPGSSMIGSVTAGGQRLSVDMRETDQEYEIVTDVPGVPKEDIVVKVGKDNVLQVTAERKIESSTDKDGIITKERSFGSFVRRIKLPASIDKDAIQAKCEHGVLTVKIPKTETEELVKTVQVE